MSEPNGETNMATALAEEWHKIALILMQKFGTDHEVITPKDIMEVQPDATIVLQELSDGIHVRITDMETAREMHRQFYKDKR